MSELAGDKRPILRQLPGVDALLNLPESAQLQVEYGRGLAVESLRAALENARETIHSGGLERAPSTEELLRLAEDWLSELTSHSLYPVINATGVIVHTNLGRAPLSAAALAAIGEISAGYSTLEFDLAAGKRGTRLLHTANLLKQLTGAAATLVVNNNAAAVLLMLAALCSGREVIISRGQLVEIGGGFRIPDVMAQSGARLVEVGTTNRTRLRDYEQAITPQTAAILMAHHSNYQIVGFTSEPELADLALLAAAHNIPLLYDQGSGALIDTAAFGLEHEPMVSEALRAGASLVAFSGDKLLGGPQAGLLCGDAGLIERISKHPLARAVRADKMCLAALAATLEHYLRGEAVSQIPVWQMIARTTDSIHEVAEAWRASLAAGGMLVTLASGTSRVGGGSLPGSSLPTTLVVISVANPDKIARRLREAPTPIIGRIQEDTLLLDPRTVLPGQAATMLDTILSASKENECR